MDYEKIKEAAQNYQDDMTRFLRAIVKNPGESCDERKHIETIEAEMKKIIKEYIEFFSTAFSINTSITVSFIICCFCNSLFRITISAISYFLFCSKINGLFYEFASDSVADSWILYVGKITQIEKKRKSIFSDWNIVYIYSSFILCNDGTIYNWIFLSDFIHL